MNRRRFLELLGKGIAASGIVYSFPSVIVPKNIAPVRLVDLFPDGIGVRFGLHGDDLLELPPGLLIPYVWMNAGLESSYNEILHRHGSLLLPN